jgi:hypothetical protein
MKKKIQAVEIMISLEIEIIQSERQIKVLNLDIQKLINSQLVLDQYYAERL